MAATKQVAERAFTTGEVSRLTGVSHRTIDFWSKSKFIRASIREATGTGSDRLYSFRDVVKISIAFELRLVGMETSSIALILAAPGADGMDLMVREKARFIRTHRNVEITVNVKAIIGRLNKVIKELSA